MAYCASKGLGVHYNTVIQPEDDGPALETFVNNDNRSFTTVQGVCANGSRTQLLPLCQTPIPVVGVLDLIKPCVLQQRVARVLELRQRQRGGTQAALHLDARSGAGKCGTGGSCVSREGNHTACTQAEASLPGIDAVRDWIPSIASCCRTSHICIKRL